MRLCLILFILLFFPIDRLSASRVKQVTDHICKLQDFVNSMLRLQVDEHEYAYLKAIVLFSPGMHQNFTFIAFGYSERYFILLILKNCAS